MSDNKRNRHSFGGKGYYIALILCAAAIGITSYVYQRNTDKTEQVLLEETFEDVLVVQIAGDPDCGSAQDQGYVVAPPVDAAVIAFVIAHK